MWLLTTARAELHSFSDPSAVPGGYAILSHTWRAGGKEQSFQEVKRIIKACRKGGGNPRDHVDEKIRKCCERAERDGYAWVWIDSCCINKESSTELSEAINSMFSWYVLAEVCYAFLEDVDTEDDPHAEDSQFQRARWHTRGWTLQELIAPAFVIFLSKTWETIGTKYDLVEPLSDCTGIPSPCLTRERSFSAMSIADRMSWAAHRTTTRVEDEAYCLLGLFNITMPPLYGEGKQAFQRLQQELAKQSLDTTLFAWGSIHDANSSRLTAVGVEKMWSGFHGPSQHKRFLFASSPRDYRRQFSLYYTPELSPEGVLQPYLASQRNYNVRFCDIISEIDPKVALRAMVRRTCKRRDPSTGSSFHLSRSPVMV